VAGHILGSAYIEFDVAATRVLFSGDLGAPYTPLLQAPKSPYKADILVLESTYGDQDHLGRRTRRMQLKQTVEKALRDGGTILIPAFSMGRTQELLYELEQIIHRSGLPLWEQLDVVVDSPLAAKFNRHYRSLSALWDKEARQRKEEGRHPLAFDHLITVESHADHLRLVQHLQRSGRAAIVIAASGMCSGGRIVNYLKALLPDKRTDLLFVGYQAVGTPGRDIQRYGPRGGYVLLDNERIDINAAVHTLGGYSAHADQKNLVDFVKRMRHKPKQIRIVHGDLSAKRVLQKLLQALVPDAEVLIPGEVMQ
jgi:metallo-beta-lactamase family protein